MTEETLSKPIVKGNIGNALTSTAKNHVVAVSRDIYDEDLGMYQYSLNAKIGKQELSIIVDQLPENGPEIGNENKIHLVKKEIDLISNKNEYTEFIYNKTTKSWEIIGDSKLHATYDEESFTLELE